MTGVSFYHYFGSEHTTFAIDKIEEEDILEIEECVSKFRDFLEAVFGRKIDEETIKKYWERM